MKHLIKKALPDDMLQALFRLREEQTFRRVIATWSKLDIPSPDAVASAKPKRIIIFPSDTHAITGALGDDAMITATVDFFRQANPDCAVDMFCSESAKDVVSAKGFTPILIPPFKSFPQEIAALFQGRPYDALVILGADIMDGYYSRTVAASLLMAADIAVKSGIPATILGCSFNDHPHPSLVRPYTLLDKRVNLNMRDDISFERVQKFAPVNAQLVADSAFTLKSGTAPQAAVSWVEDQKSQGKVLVGVNVHPMLIKHATQEQVQQLISASVDAIKSVSAKHDVAWLMLPHDYRGDDGDARCLWPIYQALSTAAGVSCYFLEGEHRAADLKATAGLLDGVITGRMHLAIAALGSGVPTMGLTYQDKFEGLFNHFDLPHKFLLPPATFDDQDRLTEAFDSFVSELPKLTQTVEQHLDGVKALSQKNFGHGQTLQ